MLAVAINARFAGFAFISDVLLVFSSAASMLYRGRSRKLNIAGAATGPKFMRNACITH